MKHPLKVGTHILSVRGESSMNEDDSELLTTGPNAVGVVQTVEYYESQQGWCYGVAFPNGVFVFLDQFDHPILPNIDNEEYYREVP